MSLDPEDARKLDALGTQLGAVAVQLATLAANVDGLRGDIARQGDGHADHEARLRVVEAHGCAQHGQRLDSLTARADATDRWRWKLTGVAAAFTFIGGAGGAGVAIVISSLLTHH